MKVLLIEGDPDLEETLAELLTGQGFEVTPANNQDDAIAALDRDRHDLVVADFVDDHRSGGGWESLEAIRARAAPTPIGIFSGWALDEVETQRRGFVFSLRKPVTSEVLLAAVAQHATAPPLSAEQRRLIDDYFAALERGDWDGLAALCREDVEYHLPGEDPCFSRTVRGRAELAGFAAETFQAFREPRFEIHEVIPLPNGALARYRASWSRGEGGRGSSEGAIVFDLRGDAIARIGVRVDLARLRAMAAIAT